MTDPHDPDPHDPDPFGPALSGRDLDDEEWAELEDAIRAVVVDGEDIVGLPALAATLRVAATLDDLGIEDPAERLEAVDEALIDVDEAFWTPDDRIVDRFRLVDGITLTHRVTDEELRTDRLALNADLTPLFELSTDGFTMTSGEATIELLDLDTDGAVGPASWGLVLPAGALGQAVPGELLGVRFAGGSLHVGRVDDPGDDTGTTDRLTASLTEAFEQVVAHETPMVTESGVVEIGHLVLAAMSIDPEAFRSAGPPLGEVLDRAGFVTHGDYVAPAGFDWEAWRSDRFALSVASQLMARHDIEADEAARLMVTIALLDEHVGEDSPFGSAADAASGAPGADDGASDADADDLDLPPAQRDTAIATLSDPHLLNAFLAEALRTLGGPAAENLGRFGAALLPHARGRDRAGIHVLLAEHATLVDRIEEAEEHLRAAVEIDDHPMARFDLARIASDRGDAKRAIDHLRHLAIDDDDPFVTMMRRYARPGPVSAGRNDPCPCGSGRKFKVCCATRDGWPLSDRVPWLLHKVRWMVATGAGFERSLDLAADVVRDPGDDDVVLDTAITNPFVHDLALFEDGGLEAYLAERGSLLPADELELVRSWVGTPRSLFEVTAVHRDSGLRVTDLRSGDVFEIREILGRHHTNVGMTVCARSLPDGAGHQFSLGVVPVELSQRAALLDLLDTDPSAEQLARFFAPRPPELRNTEGHELLFCEVVYEVDDVEVARGRLATAFEEVDEGVFHDVVEGAGTDWIRAVLTLSGDRLTLATNSDERRAAAMDRIEELDLAAVVVEEGVTSAEEVMAAGVHGPPPASLDELSPELRDVMVAKLAEMEERWVDESIPALGDLTPREALSDPTRRGDLLALLDEFAEFEAASGGRAGGFRASRLRELLGLDPPGERPRGA